MFLGKYDNSIDAKGRAIIPAKFRHKLGERCVLTKGVDKCLYIYTEEEWLKYVEEHILNRPDEDEEARKLKLVYFSNIVECDIDKQGRINIPQEFIDYAEIDKEMVNVGSVTYIQVWDKKKHTEKLSKPDMKSDILMNKMNKYVDTDKNND